MIGSMELFTPSSIADRFAVSAQFVKKEAKCGHLTPSHTSPRHFTAPAIAAWAFNRAREIQLASEAEEWTWATGTQQTLLEIPRTDADALGQIYACSKLVGTIDAILEAQPEAIDFDTLKRACTEQSRLLRQFVGATPPLDEATETQLRRMVDKVHEVRLALGHLERYRLSTAPDRKKSD